MISWTTKKFFLCYNHGWDSVAIFEQRHWITHEKVYGSIIVIELLNNFKSIIDDSLRVICGLILFSSFLTHTWFECNHQMHPILFMSQSKLCTDVVQMAQSLHSIFGINICCALRQCSIFIGDSLNDTVNKHVLLNTKFVG